MYDHWSLNSHNNKHLAEANVLLLEEHIHLHECIGGDTTTVKQGIECAIKGKMLVEKNCKGFKRWLVLKSEIFTNFFITFKTAEGKFHENLVLVSVDMECIDSRKDQA